MTWSKWDGVERIDADTYLARAQGEDAYHAARRTERTSRLYFSPLTERELMVRQAEAEDAAANALRAAVRDPDWHDVHYAAAVREARTANEVAAALTQRIGWEPIGVKTGYRHANGTPAS